MAFIFSAKNTDLDQIILVISEKIGKLLPFVGGPDHAHTLIPLLESLCEIEEVTVRNAAAISCSKILKQLSPNHKNQVSAFFELVKRMSNEELGELFYSRVSCCVFLPDLYSIMNEADRLSLREIYSRLCKDEMMIVRRAASLVFMRLTALVDPDTLTGEFLTLFKSLVADESQTVQVVVIECMNEYAALLKKGGGAGTITANILPLVKQLAEDPSWKLRQSLSTGYSKFAHSFLPGEIQADIFPALMHLIQDPDPEVRSIAMLEVLPYLEVCENAFFVNELAPAAIQLADDPMVLVRKQLAELCVDVAAKLGPEAVSAHLSDLVIKLMEDDDPLVRLRILKKMAIIAEEAPSLCTRLTEYLKALFTNSNWRVRKELLIAMPSIVRHMGPEYFMDHFHGAFLLLLKDSVDEVRVTCAEVLPKVAGAVNSNWGYEKLFPAVRELANETMFMRISMLSSLSGFLGLDLSDKFFNEVISLILNACSDKVPNVRIRCAQTLFKASTHSHLSDAQRNQIHAALTNLRDDRDRDVKYFATYPHFK